MPSNQKLEDSLSQIDKLQRLAQIKFDQFQQTHSKTMACKKGCFQCCKVNLSIFAIEAEATLIWFLNLAESKKQAIKDALKKNIADQNNCVFLTNGTCSIYEARPTICRTQGMAISLPDSPIEQQVLDICPLNKESLSSVNQTQALNLNSLNEVLATIQIQYQTQANQIESVLTKTSGNAILESRIELLTLAKLISGL